MFTPDGVEGKAVEELLGPITWRPLDQGVRDTIDTFRAAASAGRFDAERADRLSASHDGGHRMRLRNIFAASRFVIGLAVIGSFVGSAILLVIATVTLFSIAWNEIVNFDPENLSGHHIDRLAVDLIEITDIILLGTVLYIVALGLYQLFIDHNLPLPRWLKVNDLTDLKRDLIGVVVVLLGVSFLGEVVNWEGVKQRAPARRRGRVRHRGARLHPLADPAKHDLDDAREGEPARVWLMSATIRIRTDLTWINQIGAVALSAAGRGENSSRNAS